MPYSPHMPPPPPTISGSTISIDAWLANPVRVTRFLNDLAEGYSVADRMLQQGPAIPGGALIYDQLTTTDWFLDDDVEEIRPLANFPDLTSSAPNPKIAASAKYGGQVTISREARMRNRWDIVMREMVKLRNTVIRKKDTVAMAALAAAPLQTGSGVDISSSTAEQIIAMLAAAKGLVDNLEMGYDADLVLWNPTQGVELLSKAALVELLQNDGPGTGGGSPLRTGNLGRILDMDMVTSNRVTLGTARVVDSRTLGGISQEEGNGVLTNIYETDRSGPKDMHVQGWWPGLVYVSDPKAGVNLTGL